MGDVAAAGPRRRKRDGARDLSVYAAHWRVSNAYPVFAVNRTAGVAVFHDTLVPITVWMDAQENAVPPAEATVFVCGSKETGYAAAAFSSFTDRPN